MSFYASQETDVWLTPPEMVKALGHFDLDPCSPAAIKWQLADKTYSQDRGECGLMLPWAGRVWLNPPYSNWVLFMQKLKHHGNGIALIFARTETYGFFDHVWDGADSILFLQGRIRFVDINGNRGAGATAPSVLIAYGKNNTEALARSGLTGKLVQL